MSGVPWGGSEELWWRTARRMQSSGHEICVNYKWWPEPARQLQELVATGGQVWYREAPRSFWERQRESVKRFLRPSERKRGGWIDQARPEAVLITLGYHPDRIPIADELHERRIPYAINVQAASHFFFIHSDCVPAYRRWYQNAARVFFVSAENQHKLETNLAFKLENAEIVDNPFNVDPKRVVGWPDSDDVFRLACVGRIHFQSKGQDLILDALRRNFWRDKPIEITFFGKYQGNQRQLEDLIRLYGLESQVRIAGFEADVSGIWESHHALLLPSRYEGAALVVVEAMLSNRIVIATDTGRNSELIDHGRTGFIAAGATTDLVDQALREAWQARQQWREMGLEAGRSIRQRYSVDPIADYAHKLLQLGQQPARQPTSAQI
ncbi:MAG: glycosyltransferase family 4 protein [Planctomycetota bacterium]